VTRRFSKCGWVIQPGHRLRLSIESDAHCSPLRKARRQQLNRDGEAESPVGRAIDLAHAATRDRSEDFVMT